MIRNIVFDLSNVLTPFRMQEFMMEKGVTDPVMMKRVLKASAYTPYWGQFERGLLSGDEVIEKFVSADPEIAKEIHMVYDDVKGIMGKYDYAAPWVHALKTAGYKVYCLTNFTSAGYENCYDCISFIEEMDGGLFSFKEHVGKPEREMYERLLSRYDLKASECVFIDDTEENVVAAVNLGFTGIVFESYEKTVEELEKLGVVTK